MKKLVIIEDSKVIQHILKSWFSEEEYQVIILEDLVNLNERLAAFKPDLIITDIMLPNTNAIELIEAFKGVPYPKVVLSSMDTEDVSYFAERIKAIGYFTKPRDIEEIFGFIHDYFLRNDETQKALL